MSRIRKVLLRNIWCYVGSLGFFQGRLQLLDSRPKLFVCLMLENVLFSRLSVVLHIVYEFLEFAGQELLFIVNELLLWIHLRHWRRLLNVALNTKLWAIDRRSKVSFPLAHLPFLNELGLSRRHNIWGSHNIGVFLNHALMPTSLHMRHANDLSRNTRLHFLLHFLDRREVLLVPWALSHFIQNAVWISHFFYFIRLPLWTQLYRVEFGDGGWLGFGGLFRGRLLLCDRVLVWRKVAAHTVRVYEALFVYALLDYVFNAEVDVVVLWFFAAAKRRFTWLLLFKLHTFYFKKFEN